MKTINLLGASGSIGMQTVDVCLQHPDLFRIVALLFKVPIAFCLSACCAGFKQNLEAFPHFLHSLPSSTTSK